MDTLAQAISIKKAKYINKEVEMKYFLTAILLSLILFWGCEQSSDYMTGPQDQIQKSIVTGFNNTVKNDFTYDLIPLPSKRFPLISLDSLFTVSKLINGLLGGTISLNRTYISEKGKLVTILVDIVIPPLAFSGQDTITITVDNCFAVVHCAPGMNFQKPLIMTQTFIGLDLLNYNPSDIDFVYIKDDGSLEDINHGLIIVEKLTGTLTVLDALIPHFSRHP